MTSPLMMGDAWSRWKIAVPIFVWSITCPVFWNVTWLGYVVPLGMGVWLAGRVLCLRAVAADKISWQTWCLWTGVLYVLPLFGRN